MTAEAPRGEYSWLGNHAPGTPAARAPFMIEGMPTARKEPVTRKEPTAARKEPNWRQALAERRIAPTQADTQFELVSEFEPRGDQPAAIDELTSGLLRGDKHQV